jgi:hypothetical protein
MYYTHFSAQVPAPNTAVLTPEEHAETARVQAEAASRRSTTENLSKHLATADLPDAAFDAYLEGVDAPERPDTFDLQEATEHEAARCQAEIRAKRATRRQARRMGYKSVAY